MIERREQLDRWADLLKALPARVPETFAYANSYYAGSGPITIREMALRMREEDSANGGPPAG